MKNPILILCLIALTSAIYGQNLRIDTIGDQQIHTYFYDTGDIYVRWVRKGEDTILHTTTYYRNGQLKSEAWAKDSSYRFDVFGRLIDKRYSYERYDFTDKQSVKFYPNGQIEKSSWLEGNVRQVKQYKEDGQLIQTATAYSKNHSLYERIERGDGFVLHASRTDTFVFGYFPQCRTFDTSFYKNGRVRGIEIKEGNVSLSSRLYNKTGELVKTTLRDSINLIQFKDNVDCYYGLKNKNGDTIVKPMYDQIVKFNNDHYWAYQGVFVFLFDLKGAPIKLPISNLTDLKNADRSYFWRKKETFKKQLDDEEYQLMQDTASVYYVFETDNKYGIMDAQFHIVLPPQYLHLSGKYLGDADYFQFIEMQKDSITNQGYLTREGKQLFNNASLKWVNYSGYKDYFKISTTHFAYDTYYNLENQYYYDYQLKRHKREVLPLQNTPTNLIGLAKSDGTIILDKKFHTINPIDEAPLFVTSVIKKNKTTQTAILLEGIFNADTKHWLLDTTAFIIKEEVAATFPFFIIEHVLFLKQGIIDTTGKYILPLQYDYIRKLAVDKNVFLVTKEGKSQLFEIKDVPNKRRGNTAPKGVFILPVSYDTIEQLAANDHLFIVKKDEKYQIFDVKQGNFKETKPKYDFLAAVPLLTEPDKSESVLFYFLAKLNGKWGVIDANDKLIKPFEYDYASIDAKAHRFTLVKDNQALPFDLASLPKRTDLPKDGINSVSFTY